MWGGVTDGTTAGRDVAGVSMGRGWGWEERGQHGARMGMGGERSAWDADGDGRGEVMAETSMVRFDIRLSFDHTNHETSGA